MVLVRVLSNGARIHKLGWCVGGRFETALKVPTVELQALGDGVKVFAVALDTNGQVVGRSGGVSV